MLPDQSLSEAVVALQRLDLAPEARELADEAGRLLGEGRDGEARALVEKAEAWIAPTTGAAAGNGNDSRRPALQAIIAPLAAKLATGFTGVLTSVLEDIHQYTGGQIQAVAKSLQEHIENMETALREAAGLGERLEQLANEQQANLQGVQQGQEELWAAVRALQEGEREQNESISRVAEAAGELSNHLANHADAVTSRFAAMEERVTALDRFAQEMPAQIESVVARFDGHTATLRLLEERQAQRVATLNAVLDSLAGLREQETAEMGLPAVA